VDIDQLLTATRSAWRSLDLDTPVDLDEIRGCLRTGLQAPSGSNQQSWRWLVVTDQALRDRIADLYRAAYLGKVGGQLIAGFMPSGTPEAKLMSSTEWLFENLARVPVLVIPCYEPTMPRADGDESLYLATLYGSIFPAVWNFQLRCTHVAMGPASRHCTCTTNIQCANCSGYPSRSSRPVCYPSGGCGPDTHSHRHHAEKSTRSSASTDGRAHDHRRRKGWPP
jgi:nitroreductase